MSEAAETWPIPWQPVHGDRGGALALLEAQLAQGGLAALGALPPRAQALAAGALGRLARRLDARHTGAARRFLRQAYGDALTPAEVEQRVLEAWRFFFLTRARSWWLADVVRAGGVDRHFTLEFADGVREALLRPRGRVLVTPHLGDFEAGALALPHLGLGPVYAVARPPRNRYLSIEIQRLRELRGMRLLHRHGAMEDVARILAANGTLILLVDQRARRRTVVAPFFGRLAHNERAPSILLRRLKAPLFACWCEALPEPWRYKIRFTRVFEPDDYARATPEEISTALNREMENMILSAPAQYFWFHDRYRKAPQPS